LFTLARVLMRRGSSAKVPKKLFAPMWASGFPSVCQAGMIYSFLN
jgi:hypothetical protein